jgi:hypothetical protein
LTVSQSDNDTAWKGKGDDESLFCSADSAAARLNVSELVVLDRKGWGRTANQQVAADSDSDTKSNALTESITERHTNAGT